MAFRKDSTVYPASYFGELKHIPNSRNYISRFGDVLDTVDGGLIKRSKHINKHNGYVYSSVYYKDCEGANTKSRRLHVLLAKAWIHNPRPDVYDIVGHMDNDKSNYSLDNLYWTSSSENTQKAVDDGLMVNDIGIEDSQSQPIAAYKNTGELIGVYGSITEASRCIDGASLYCLTKVIDKSNKGIKGYYYLSIDADFYHQHEDLQQAKFSVGYIKKIQAKIQVTKPTGEIILFPNQKQAAKSLGNIRQSAISHCLRDHNGYHSATGHHFKRVFDEAA